MKGVKNFLRLVLGTRRGANVDIISEKNPIIASSTQVFGDIQDRKREIDRDIDARLNDIGITAQSQNEEPLCGTIQTKPNTGKNSESSLLNFVSDSEEEEAKKDLKKMTSPRSTPTSMMFTRPKTGHDVSVRNATEADSMGPKKLFSCPVGMSGAIKWRIGRFSVKETALLIEGIEEHGVGRWKLIQETKCFPNNISRTQTSLKDKARSLGYTSDRKRQYHPGDKPAKKRRRQTILRIDSSESTDPCTESNRG
ncbi:hypothetical protein BWQ96_09567 [Gracilariopsis chorda]|uniref:Myb-like domain-containing protein n=1 Tax=Gracilariopsis chorda TaxID=448386 RepID=A0A2V3IF86_9FLOR|nr:hypothetical protein BWQ96_09567 [Gracilariopsis chorda]|eukprot:PXF40734.1 hypothetical protein BWQ96_09567 [Gracilariopsis chorda]